jgi:hypothetical protein
MCRISYIYALLISLVCSLHGYSQDPNIFHCVGNVGIGTLAPSAKLDIIDGPAWMGNWKKSIRLNPAGSIQFALTDRSFLVGADSGRFQILTNNTADGSGITRSAMMISGDGNVGIGAASSSNYKLAVAGSVIAEKVVVKLQANWPDYVFDETYKRMPLEELAAFIQQNHHLPGMKPAKQVEQEGMDVAETNTKLLEKVEELTLFMIELWRKNQKLETELERLKTQPTAPR